MAEDKELCDGLTNKPTRVRRYHTRSRTGCSSCRSRRKRCGEQRPVCDSCVSSGRVCSYEPAQLPLRERRAHQKEVQPWDQKPSWQVKKPSQQATFHKETPIPAPLGYVSYDAGYNRLACEMPLRSHELFHYLLNSAQGPKNGMNVSNTNGLTRLTDDPFGLRSTLLLAGMHFCFQYGNLEPFESTFFYHRVQVIKYINKWISNGSPKPDPRIIRQMVTLSFTELCNGQILLAEAHVSGILAIIESKNRAKGEELFAIRPRSTDEELTNRYFIMAYTYICGLKSLLIGICRHGKSGSSLKDYTGKELVQMSYIWHKAEALESWISKLEGIREIPSFLTPLPHGATLNNADAYNLIQPLRRFTAGIDSLSTGVQSADDDFDTFWRLGSASRMLGAFVRTHLESISVRKGNSELRRSQSDSFEAPWGAVVTAFVIYAQTILCVIEPVEPRMHKYTVTLFHHDMALYFSESRTPDNPAFILWLLVMGLVGCHTSSRDDEDLTIHPSTSFFQTAVRQQSKEMGISCWSQAIKALTEVTWPTTCDRSGFIQELWESSVSTES